MDDDVVVQHDLTPLWDLDLSRNVVGAVGLGEGTDGHCLGKRLGHYFNFSNPLVELLPFGLERNQCAWLSGMNIFDLQAWRRTNITLTYRQLLKQASSFRQRLTMDPLS